MRADVVDPDDVRMREARDRECLLLEAPQADRVLREFRRQHLDRHVPLQPRIVGA